MDLLANVLGMTRLGNAVLGQSELIPPWGMEVDMRVKAAVHLVQRGVCWLEVDGMAESICLVPGALALVTCGVRHTLRDGPGTPVLPYKQAVEAMRTRRATAPPDATAQAAVLLCAEYEFEQDGPHPLIGQLPRLIHIRADAAQADAPLQTLMRLLMHEASQGLSGRELVVPRLIDSLLVYIVRAWIASQPEARGGWFCALRDPRISRALALMHDSPRHPWTVEMLAQRVAQSRAVFARRFTSLVGEPPMSYLTRWRIGLAAKLLKTSDKPIESIALDIGYDSAAAFARAFRRRLGVPPGRYRAQRGLPRAADVVALPAA